MRLVVMLKGCGEVYLPQLQRAASFAGSQDDPVLLQSIVDDAKATGACSAVYCA
jgi:hypothetical protein